MVTVSGTDFATVSVIPAALSRAGDHVKRKGNPKKIVVKRAGNWELLAVGAVTCAQSDPQPPQRSYAVRWTLDKSQSSLDLMPIRPAESPFLSLSSGSQTLTAFITAFALLLQLVLAAPITFRMTASAALVLPDGSVICAAHAPDGSADNAQHPQP